MSDVGQQLFSLAPAVIFHPLTYFRTLVQLGHEPLTPYLGPRFPFSSVYVYYHPNAFGYLRHIREEDGGFFAMYRGLGPKLCCSFFGGLVSQMTLETIESNWQKREEIKAADTEIEAWRKLFTNVAIESVSQSAGVIVSYPFHVLMVRSMAQFIGKEHIYDNAFSGAIEMYNNEGIRGFFGGLVPRLIGEVLTILLAQTLIHVVDRYIQKEQEGHQKSLTKALCSMVASACSFPYFTVSVVMIVNGSGLVAGTEPLGRKMFPNWRECYCYLNKLGAVKRGSSMFWRKCISTQID